MVYPKPGLKFRYQFKLPDNVQRPKQRKNRDYAKMYKMLSEEDHFDIRGIGLKILDLKEAAVFDREREEERKQGDTAPNHSKKVVSQLRRASYDKRTNNEFTPSSSKASLTSQLKRNGESEDADNKKKKKTIGGANVGEQEQEKVFIEDTGNGKEVSREVSNPGEHTPGNSKMLEDITANTSIVQPTVSTDDDSSKENEVEGMTKTKLRHSFVRAQKLLVNVASADVGCKSRSRCVCNTTVAKTPIEAGNKKVEAVDVKTVLGNEPGNRMNIDEVTTKLSSLGYVKATWPQTESAKKQMKALAQKKMMDPAQKKMKVPAQKELKVPAQKKMKVPAQRKMKVPAQKKMKVPAQKKMKVPAQKKMKVPAQKKMKAPAQKKMKVPAQKKMKDPAQKKNKAKAEKKKESKSKKKSNTVCVSKCLPGLNGPYTNENQEMQQGPYKEQAPVLERVEEKKIIRKPRLPIEQMTQTQLLRRIRYIIEKYFAEMPGINYHCPKKREQAFARKEVNGKTIWICLVCNKEEFDEKGDVMIGCDTCEDWYHLRCIGVPDEKYPANRKWYCKRCMTERLHLATFDPKDFPLFI